MSHTSYQQLAAGPTSQPPLFLPHPLRPSTSHLDHSSSRPPSFLSHSMSPAELPERAGSSGQHTGPRGSRARRRLLLTRSRGVAAADGMGWRFNGGSARTGLWRIEWGGLHPCHRCAASFLPSLVRHSSASAPLPPSPRMRRIV
jgi:hypothetical protein